MPDIDVDFCFERRGEVIEYVRQKYGRESVGQIITFGTLKSRAAIKDVGRVLGFTPAETDALAKLIPNQPNFSLTVKEAIEQIADVRKLYESDERYRQLLDYAIALEGLSRHAGVHAAGIVIAPGPLDDYVPICTQESKGAGAGETTSRGRHAVRHERAREGRHAQDGLPRPHDAHGDPRRARLHSSAHAATRPNLDALPLDDDRRRTGMLRAGRTAGVFQFESPLATDMLREHALRPLRRSRRVERADAPRPARRRHAQACTCARKRGEEPVTYALPELEPILAPTYGVITYQEQVMRIAQMLAGISLAEADVLRKAVGKKDAELIEQELGKFVEKAIARGYDRKIIEELAGTDRDVRPLRLQQVALGRVLGDLVSHRVAQDALSGRVHGRAAVGADRRHGLRW